MNNNVDVKVVDVATDNILVEEFNFYECVSCHWRFIGDAQRYNCGFIYEGTDLFNFCPMCGKKIEGVVD
ncbi:hypothetical protein CHF27_011110 [Romboutsia maritimum]|uniref:Uncharacterized protein n=1 Tax=Romboutsia maritimum TaxID=2020948 RepID=A0A371IQV9_9FIRM|nr:hypothetical protein [Romboutsia maritimum]RDY22862.1 hypothetical protein CHF27_011110 [Romboutsia maritimum]